MPRRPPPPPAPRASSEDDAPTFLSRQVTTARRFYLNLNPSRRAPLAVVCGGWEACAADYAIDRRDFPYLSIEFVAQGRGEVSLGGARPQALGAGSLFTYGPGTAQRIRSSAADRLEKYFVDFAGTHARALLRDVGLAPGAVVRLGPTSEVRDAFDRLINLALDRDPHTERACALQLELLVLLIARAMRPASPAERRARATFERVRAHIDAHFLSLRGLSAIASACHVDASHLCRLFRRFQGETPFRYLQDRRMRWAADRLDLGARLVGEVAEELAMDPFQFSRVFRRTHGVPPSAFARARAKPAGP
ncbi:MAG: AraC family transcriptional regulator [Opitutaceae bacterium]|jgi:AraC-like DNA-binding protein|nr:AraC family transcriptional regulator [Opitutaceae bacterium]